MGSWVRPEGQERWRRASLDQVGDSGLYLLMVDNEPTELYLERRRGGVVVTIGRHIFDYTVERWRPALENRKRASDTQSGVHKVPAPTTGLSGGSDDDGGCPRERGAMWAVVHRVR
ncbi:MAG: hypothetical protein U5Q44_09590 [Dehalococcoidia bacterium]|nr:hypothetical protein [Dehalococcoidia bacterium]